MTRRVQGTTKKLAPARPVVIANVGDIHAGSSVAISPPVIPLDDGGEYHASKAQLWLYQNWLAYWKRVDEVRKAANADLYIILNGDAVDGDHHNTSQLISRNPGAQYTVLADLLKTPLALKPDQVYVVRGTEAHVGHSASHEEGIANGLMRDKRPIIGDPDTGTSSWWHLRMDVHNTRLDVTHHGRTGMREHTRAGIASLHAHDILLSHVKSNDQPPNLCLRAHFHRFNDSNDACSVRVVTNGAWQLKTGYVHAKHADSLADIGGLIITIRPNAAPDKYELEKVHFKASRGTVWRAA